MNLRKFFRSFVYAFEGIATAMRSEQNFRVHIAAAVMALAAGFYFRIERWEWCAIAMVIALVLATEIINTAIEELGDHLFKEPHPVAKRVKDLAAAAVLVMAVAALAVAALIFLPRILEL